MYCTVESLIESNRLFQVLNDRLKASSCFSEELYIKIVKYIDSYFTLKKASLEDVEKAYLTFIRNYNKDVKAFIETNKYPYELAKTDRQDIDRFSYNVVLLLSVVFTPHRFRIMQLLDEKLNDGESLVIGCGPGLEISLINSNNIDAYDLSIEKELKLLNSNVAFHETYFDGSVNKKYNQILLIEILEHLERPIELLEICKKALRKRGYIHLTTATNIPQFDHLYNFQADHIDFEKEILNCGFEIVFDEDITHEYLTTDPQSKNKYYIIKLK